MSDAPLQPIVCCLGDPLAGNPMQLLMERAFRAAGLDWRFLSFEVSRDRLADAVRGLKALGFHGAAFTTPHQVAVIELLDRLTPEAQAIGAVNCAYVQGGVWVGDNTDGPGFIMALQGLVEPQQADVVVLGAGGTARAVSVELAKKQIAKLTIVNRTLEHAQDLADQIAKNYSIETVVCSWEGTYQVPAETSLLIHATTLGWCDSDESPAIDFSLAKPELVVADVIFNPPETQLLADARRRGLKTLSGIQMMANQVAIAYQKWTGAEPQTDIIRETLEEYLEV